MTEISDEHKRLLIKVSERLIKTPSVTDRLMILKWRIISLSQYLLGGKASTFEQLCKATLESFVAKGPSDLTDITPNKLRDAIRNEKIVETSILPSISEDKRNAVAEKLAATFALGHSTIASALAILPGLNDRLDEKLILINFPGVKYRFDTVANILTDLSQPDESRMWAASAIHYVDNINDVIPDDLGAIGLLDDDYALRLTLEKLVKREKLRHLHWTEKISILWDELPFIQGVALRKHLDSIQSSWLDRVYSHFAYTHVMDSKQSMLLLLQPTIRSNPLHTIIALMGILIYDAMTLSYNRALKLCLGQVYEIDRSIVVRFDGIDAETKKVRLRFVDGLTIHAPPDIADRMTRASGRELSRSNKFLSKYSKIMAQGPIQRFFQWDVPILAGSIDNIIMVITSNERAKEMFNRVSSNGVFLVSDGLVRLLGEATESVDLNGVLTVTVSSLSAARELIRRGHSFTAIIVDEYHRLHSGRHELPFLKCNGKDIPIILWCAEGYFPQAVPAWIPEHVRLEVSAEDLADIRRLDQCEITSVCSATYNGNAIVENFTSTRKSDPELHIIGLLDEFIRDIRQNETIPEYFGYQIVNGSNALRQIIRTTPAEWLRIKAISNAWRERCDEAWAQLRPTALEALGELCFTPNKIDKLVKEIEDSVNSVALDILRLFRGNDSSSRAPIICETREQQRVVKDMLSSKYNAAVEPILMSDLKACGECIAIGWPSLAFARRLLAHSPVKIIVISDGAEFKKWEALVRCRYFPKRRSIFEAITDTLDSRVHPDKHAGIPGDPAIEIGEDENEEKIPTKWKSQNDNGEEYVNGIFVSVDEEYRAKCLANDSRVIIKNNETIRETSAVNLVAGDCVILGANSTRWSPDDEFTDIVVDAMRLSRPESVLMAKEWRRALKQKMDDARITVDQLQSILKECGIVREKQTIHAWLDLERVYPIAPRGMRSELKLLWNVIQTYSRCTLNEAIGACAELRSLRLAAGKTLLKAWHGEVADDNVNETLLNELVRKLRQEVSVFEVYRVTRGRFPRSLLGSWIPSEYLNRFQIEDHSGITNLSEGDE